MPSWYSCFPYVLEGGTCDCEEYDDIQANKTFIPRWAGVSVIYLDISLLLADLEQFKSTKPKEEERSWGSVRETDRDGGEGSSWATVMKTVGGTDEVERLWGSPSCTYFILRMAGFQRFFLSSEISALLLIAFFSLKPPCLCSQFVFLSPIPSVLIRVQNTSKTGTKLKWYWHTSA